MPRSLTSPMKKTTLFALFVFIYSVSFAQIMSIVKAQDAIDNKQFEKCLKLVDKGLEKDRTLVELYYYRAWAEYELAKTQTANADMNYAKMCVKSIQKAIDRDETKEYKKKYSFLIRQISDFHRAEGLEFHHRNQFGKAIPIFETCYELSGDTTSYVYLGLCYWAINNRKTAIPILHKTAEWMHGAWEKNTGKEIYNVLVFQEMAKYYSSRNSADTALLYIEMGMDIFPNDIKLSKTAVEVVKMKISSLKKETGLNAQVLAWVERGMKYNKSDIEFLELENDYHLQRLNYLFLRKNISDAASLDSTFYQSKKREVLAGVVNKNDEYLIADSAKFVDKLLQVFLSKNNEKAIVYYFYKWYPLAFKTPQINEKGLEIILKNPPSAISKRLIMALLHHGSETYPKNVNFKNYRLSIYRNWVKGPIHNTEWKYLFNLNDSVSKNFPKSRPEFTADREKLLTRAVDTFIGKGEMEISWGYFRKLKREFPKNLLLDSLNKRLAIADFNIRYKNTRIYSKKSGSTQVAQTGWDGISKSCKYGSIPDSTQQKVTDRINYFRQNAGVRDIVTYNKNQAQKCQEASVMYAPIGVFTREPTPETHLCYSQEAAEAARFGQMVKDNNPAIAATVLMSDEKSEELYNRQYILAPHGLYYGFGASENNTVFWMVHPEDKLIDSAYYDKNYISWPPQGYCPRMFLFSKWSFSMNADLSKAKVEVSSKSLSKVSCTTKVEKSPMLPFSTLVITPKIEKYEGNLLPVGEKITVTITLSPKNIISYDFSVIDPK